MIPTLMILTVLRYTEEMNPKKKQKKQKHKQLTMITKRLIKFIIPRNVRQIIIPILLLSIVAINVYDVWYKPDPWELLMDINENNSRLLESGDPIMGLDDLNVKYRVTAINKVNDEIVSVSNTINVKPSLYIYVPNAFTPNEDGLNDTFGGLGVGVKNYHLVIYNRLGQLVFETDKQADQWDGTYGGKPAPIGSYAYAIDVKGYYDNDFHKEGTISIVKV